MKQSQMHPDHAGSRLTRFVPNEADRYLYSREPGKTRKVHVDIRYAGGSLSQLCREVASPGCVFAGGLIDRLQAPLPDEERGEIEHAVLKRQREFVAGRTSARLALLQLGYPDQAVPRSDSRAPIWPEGVVGSISHNSRYCVAVTSFASTCQGIGIDIERPDGLSAELTSLVCTPKEKEFLLQRDEPVRGRLAKLFFSAKESVYKCVFPILKEPLEFEDIEIVFDLEARSFQATLSPGTNGRKGIINGLFACNDELLLTLAVLPQSSSRPSSQLSGLTALAGTSRPATARCQEAVG